MLHTRLLISLAFTLLTAAASGGEVPLGGAARGAGEDGTWLRNHGKAEVLSRVRQRPMLALFTGSDWCGWCIRLQKEALSKPEFRAYAAENLVLVELDFPRRKAQGEMEKKVNRHLMGVHKVEGYPTLLLFDPKGKEIGRLGYMKGGAPALIGELRTLVPKR